MRISQLIAKLEKIQAKEGDLNVSRSSHVGVRDLDEVGIKYLKILNKKQSRPCYWDSWSSDCNKENKGEKVLAI